MPAKISVRKNTCFDLTIPCFVLYIRADAAQDYSRRYGCVLRFGRTA